jgi:exopolysaccharide biosynthesis protein
MSRLTKASFAASSLLAIALAPQVARADVTTPFSGVTLVDHGDRALAIANLCSAGVSIRVTKYAERQATPEAWATRADVNAVIATNGDFFDFPGWTYVVGRAMGAGEEWPAADQNRENRTYWQFGPKMADLISPASTAPTAGATNMIGGHNTIIRDGESLAPNFDGDSVILGTFRRTGIGLNASRTKVFSFASNTALNGADMAASMLAMAAEGGAPDLDLATNEDGGGSSQMYVKGRGQIIDSGRQVNDHFGIIATGSGASPMCAPRAATIAEPTLPAMCGKIEPGHGLGQGDAVGSCDGKFTLMEQSDGNLNLYGPAGKLLFSSNTAGWNGYALIMQGDGNLVDYSPYSHPAFFSATAGHPGAFTAIQSDGNVVVVDGTTVLYQTGTSDATAPTAPTQAILPAPKACGKIESGSGLAQGTSVMSCDRRFTLSLAKNGNLTETETATGKILWNRRSDLTFAYVLAMQTDGNLVLYTPYETALWNAATAGNAGATLAIQDDGNLVVYSAAGKALWNSGTTDKSAPVPPLAADGGVLLLPDGGIASSDGTSENGDSRGSDGSSDGGCAVSPSSRLGEFTSVLVALALLLGISKRRQKH